MSLRRGRLWWTAGLALALLCAGVLSFYASSAPDGLEWVAGRLGFAAAGKDGAAPLAGYQVAGVREPRLSGGLAGVAGVLVVLALTSVLTWAVRRRRSATA